MEVEVSNELAVSESYVFSRISQLEEYQRYQEMWSSELNAASIRKNTQDLLQAITAAGITADVTRATVSLLETTTLGTPQRRSDALSFDLRQHFNSEQLASILQEDNFSLQAAVESTIATCRDSHHSDWHVWISTLVALKEARQGEGFDVFTGSFLYPSARHEITRRLVEIPFRNINTWTTSALKAITDVISEQPAHFLIKVPRTQLDFAKLAHGALVQRSMLPAVKYNSLLPYCYGVYECSGVLVKHGNTVLNTCVPLTGYGTSGYILQQDVQGVTLADSLGTISQEHFDALLVVIASTLATLHYTYGFIHGNLSPTNIILEHRGELRPVYFSRYLVNGIEYRRVDLPFTPRLINFECSQTKDLAWVSNKSLPNQSPVADIHQLYSSLIDLKPKRLDLSAVNDIHSLIRGRVPDSINPVLWPEGRGGFRDIYRYIISGYDVSLLGERIEDRVDPYIELPDQPHVDNAFAIRRDADLIRQALNNIQINEEYTTNPSVRILKDWLSLRFTEDHYLLGEAIPTTVVLRDYLARTGQPLLYDSEDRLILTDDMGRSLVEYTAGGKPIVYHPDGTPTIYEEETRPLPTTIGSPALSPVSSAASSPASSPVTARVNVETEESEDEEDEDTDE